MGPLAGRGDVERISIVPGKTEKTKEMGSRSNRAQRTKSQAHWLDMATWQKGKQKQKKEEALSQRSARDGSQCKQYQDEPTYWGDRYISDRERLQEEIS